MQALVFDVAADDSKWGAARTEASIIDNAGTSIYTFTAEQKNVLNTALQEMLQSKDCSKLTFVLGQQTLLDVVKNILERSYLGLELPKQITNSTKYYDFRILVYVHVICLTEPWCRLSTFGLSLNGGMFGKTMTCSLLL